MGSTDLTLESLRTAFHLPRESAAEALGVTVNELKKALKVLKIERWPFRKLSSLQALQADLEEQLVELESTDETRTQALELREMHARIGEDMAKIRLDPNHQLDEALHKLRLQNYKARFIKQHGGGPAGKGRRANSQRPATAGVHGATSGALLGAAPGMGLAAPQVGGAAALMAGGPFMGSSTADCSQTQVPLYGAEPTHSTGSASSGARRSHSGTLHLKRSADAAAMGPWDAAGMGVSGASSMQQRSRRALGQPPQPPLPRSVVPPVVMLPERQNLQLGGRGYLAPGARGYGGQFGPGHHAGGMGSAGAPITLAALPMMPEEDVLDGVGMAAGHRSAYSAPLYDETSASQTYGHSVRGPVGHMSEAQLNRQYSTGLSGLNNGVAAIKLEQQQFTSGLQRRSSQHSTPGAPQFDQVAAGDTPPWMVPLGVPDWETQPTQAPPSRYTSCPADWGQYQQQQSGGPPQPPPPLPRQAAYEQSRFGHAAAASQPLPGSAGQAQQWAQQQQQWHAPPRRMRTVEPKLTPLEEMLAELANTGPLPPDSGAASMLAMPHHSQQQQSQHGLMQGMVSGPAAGSRAMYGGQSLGGQAQPQDNASGWLASGSALQHQPVSQSGQLSGQPAAAGAGPSGAMYQQGAPRSTVFVHEPPLPSSFFLLNSDDDDDDEISRLLSGAQAQPRAGHNGPRSMTAMQNLGNDAPGYTYRAPNTAPMPGFNAGTVFGSSGQFGAMEQVQQAPPGQGQGYGQAQGQMFGGPQDVGPSHSRQHAPLQGQQATLAPVVTTGHDVPIAQQPAQWGAESRGFHAQQLPPQHQHSGILQQHPQQQQQHMGSMQQHSDVLGQGTSQVLHRHSMPVRPPVSASAMMQPVGERTAGYGSLQALSMPPAGESMRQGGCSSQQPHAELHAHLKPGAQQQQQQMAAWLQQQQQSTEAGSSRWLAEQPGPGPLNGHNGGFPTSMEASMEQSNGPSLAELQQMLDDEMGLG